MKSKGKIRSAGLTVAAGFLCIVLAACACQPAKTDSSDSAGSSGGEEAPLVSFDWSPDADCAACHTKEERSRTDADCQLSLGHSGLDCMQCHVDAVALESAHGQASPDAAGGGTKLAVTSVEDAVCLGCHEADYTPDAAAGFSGCTDRNGTVVNPHALPDGSSHSDIGCVLCHCQHSDKGLDETAPQLCIGCHHENVYECGTCH